jgi:hypothetical protein
MSRLTNLDISRVDYVKRGAVRDPLNPDDPQRLLLWKSDDDDDPKDAVTVLNRIRKAVGGNNEAALEAVVSAMKLIKPHIDDLPEDVQEAFDELAEAAGVDVDAETPATAGSPEAGDDEARMDKAERDDQDAIMQRLRDLTEATLQQHLDAKRQNPALADISREQALAKALNTPQGRSLYAHYRALGSSSELRKAEAEIRNDALSLVDRLAANLQEGDPGLSREQAVAKALTTSEGREAYATYVRRQSMAPSTGSPAAVRKQEALSRAESAAEQIRKDEPTLTREQAMVRALKDDPGLYKAYLEGK